MGSSEDSTPRKSAELVTVLKLIVKLTELN